MSSRRGSAAVQQPRQELALYKKVSFDGEEENGAPDYIRVSPEQASKQAVKLRRRASTPGKREVQAPARRRASTNNQLPQTPPSPTLRTPARRSTIGRPRGSVIPKLDERRRRENGNESSPVLFEDGRGSPKERRRKSQLANSLPRGPDGRFLPSKNDAEEYQSDEYQSEEESSGYGSNKKKSATPAQRRSTRPDLKERAVTPRAQRLAPVKDDEVANPKKNAVSFQQRRNIALGPDPNEESASSSSRSGDSIQSGDSFNGFTNYNKTINNILVVSDSSIGNQSVSLDEEE